MVGVFFGFEARLSSFPNRMLKVLLFFGVAALVHMAYMIYKRSRTFQFALLGKTIGHVDWILWDFEAREASHWSLDLKHSQNAFLRDLKRHY